MEKQWKWKRTLDSHSFKTHVSGVVLIQTDPLEQVLNRALVFDKVKIATQRKSGERSRARRSHHLRSQPRQHVLPFLDIPDNNKVNFWSHEKCMHVFHRQRANPGSGFAFYILMIRDARVDVS